MQSLKEMDMIYRYKPTSHYTFTLIYSSTTEQRAVSSEHDVQRSPPASSLPLLLSIQLQEIVIHGVGYKESQNVLGGLIKGTEYCTDFLSLCLK